MADDALLTPQRAQLTAEQGALPLPPSPAPSPSPLRRSPRFSSPLPPIIPEPAAEIEEHVEDENLQSRPITPDNEQVNDEPSSVLASRIMRSHTNPSPPPQSPDAVEKPLAFFPIDSTTEPGLDSQTDTPSKGTSPAPEIMIHQPVPIRYPQGALSPMQDANVYPTSLFSEQPSRESSFCFTVEEPSQPQDPTIIPLPPSPSVTPMLVDANLREEPNTTDEEADVADSLIPTELDSPMPSSSRFSLPTEDPHTPVRRSSRPRKSLLDSPLPTISPLKNKGKGRADVAPSETTPRPKFDVARREMSPLRAQLKESARAPRRPLDSLSPGTVGLLGTLVPSKTPSPLPEVNEAEPSLPLPFRFPKPDATPATASSLPLRPPNRLPSPRRDRSASPTRSLLRDDPQTPSRRIPIEEAIANLRSPTKASGGQSFKLKIRPTDSPARRGPPPTADSLATPRPLKTSIFDKPSSSPTRSRSMEPSPTARTKILVRSGSAEPSIPSLPFPLLPARSRIPTSIPEDAEVSMPISSEAPTSDPPLQPQPQKSVLRQHTPSKIPRLKPYARPASSINVNKSRLPMRQVDFSTAPKPTAGASKPVPKLKAMVEIDSSSLKRKRSTAEEHSQSPLKIRNLRPVPNISSPLKPLPSRLNSSPTVEDTAEMGNSAGASAQSASLPTEPHLPEPRSSIVESSIPQPSESSSAVRRTTRTRRAITPSIDMFPKPASELPPPRQRKPPAVRTEISLFRGLTPAAWTSMTKSNTARNEAYQAAKLEIEVVRKEGIRPDSPILKVKTKSQKEQDERGRQRSQRAERRAQRVAGGSSTDGRNSASLEENGLDDDWDIDVEGSPLRHRRGPGDEEDYVTPDRPPPSKKARFGDVEEKEGKCVKWDRGLQTTLFMDEIKFRDNLPKENTTNVKGILAPAAKSLTLDKLGNLVTESSSPLKDLVPENVIVKKIVYDSDFPSPPVVEPARNTRSRTKKKS